MSRPLRIQYPGAFYHVTSRGNEKKDIFIDRADRKKFIYFLDLAVKRYKTVIHVYCLLNNHYHLLIETPEGNLSSILHYINTSYTSYFNKRRERVGHLFQGRFKSFLVDKDSYALELSRYVHLNPVRAGMVKKPEDFEWSSFRDYVDEMKHSPWLHTDFILGLLNLSYLERKQRYKEFVHEGIKGEVKNPLNKADSSIILGKKQYIDWIKQKYINKKDKDRDVPQIEQLKRKCSIEQIKTFTEKILEVNYKEKRRIALFLCHQYSGRSLKEIGNEFGQISQAAVTQNSIRVRNKIKEDINLRNKIEKLEEIILQNKKVKSVDLTPL